MTPQQMFRLGRRRVEAELSQLLQEGGRPRTVGQRLQCAQRVATVDGQHRAEGVGVDAHPPEFGDELLEVPFVSHSKPSSAGPGTRSAERLGGPHRRDPTCTRRLDYRIPTSRCTHRT